LTHNYTGYPMVKEARELVQSGALGTILGPCLWINERSISKSTLGAPSRERINRWYVQYPPTARATAVATDDMHTKRSGDIGVFIKISVV
jgi:predicted dehydrogenase